jgi:hypothetical protein
MALKSATGAPLAVAAEDRKYVPTGIQATVVAGEEESSDTLVHLATKQNTMAGVTAASKSDTTVTSRPQGSEAQSAPERQPTASAQNGPSTDAGTAPAVTAPAASAAASLNGKESQGGYLGATSNDMPRVRHNGVTLSAVEFKGPAYESGLQAGDVILTLNGTYIYTVEDMGSELRKLSPGMRIVIRYMRGSTIYETYAVLAGTTRF